jgi:hypothetical protein
MCNRKEDHQAKIEMITFFFDDLDVKINFLQELSNNKHHSEAITLCSCYIDALSSAFYPDEERSSFRFVRAIKEHSGEEIFTYIHPKMFDCELLKLKTKRNSKWEEIYSRVSSSLQQAQGRLYTEQEINDLIFPLLTDTELKNINSELWRGSFAAIVYFKIRIPSVHGFGGSDILTFNKTTINGLPAPPIEFAHLYACLKCLSSKARNNSLNTGKWFGHDFKNKD